MATCTTQVDPSMDVGGATKAPHPAEEPLLVDGCGGGRVAFLGWKVLGCQCSSRLPTPVHLSPTLIGFSELK